MVVQNKQTLRYVYQTLKPIMDKSVADLHTCIEIGNVASLEQSVIYQQISNLQYYIMNNRHDRETVLDAERDLCDYEDQAAGISKKISRGKSAAKQLGCVEQFYKNYDRIIVAPKMVELGQIRQTIEDRMDKLSERVFSCSENMDESERGTEISVQYANDMLKYEEEYAQLAGRLASVCNEKAKLRRK